MDSPHGKCPAASLSPRRPCRLPLDDACDVFVSVEDSVRCLRSARAWESFSRQHAEVAVSRPVLDLSPKRKFDRELQKSMSFRNWKPDIDDHPLICQTESFSSQKGETKRAASPTDSQKAKLESLRAAVKNDLRRAIMKRAHSPDSARGHTEAFIIKKKDITSCFEASQKLLSLGDNDDHSLDVPPSMTSRYSVDDEDVAFSWDEDDDSLLFSDDGKALLLDDLEWDDLEDDQIATPDVQDSIGRLRNTWSMQPLEHSSDGDPDKPQLLTLTGGPFDIYDDDEPSKLSCFDKRRGMYGVLSMVLSCDEGVF